ncbi:hypothetical protein RDI58_000805 [Solanum bulbocastanum]|uniref:Uncharacterized protein n=1 Tax=Solanum bulbocastanum TaxID=147425 RepID=A0AAN8UBL8_SOLBU
MFLNSTLLLSHDLTLKLGQYTKRRFYYTTYRQSTQLTPRCQFEVTIQDDSSSTIVMISDKIGEELLSLIVAEIHDICCIKGRKILLATSHCHSLHKQLQKIAK